MYVRKVNFIVKKHLIELIKSNKFIIYENKFYKTIIQGGEQYEK